MTTILSPLGAPAQSFSEVREEFGADWAAALAHDTKTVTVPAAHEHQGLFSKKVTLRWFCPECGARRGEPFATFSYDGSRRLGVDGWKNPCGHVYYYADVRKEALVNGLNGENK